jgi:hypothetical protein
MDKDLLQKQLMMTTGASTLVNTFMFVMNVERCSRLKLHSLFTKRIICTYSLFHAPIVTNSSEGKMDYFFRRATTCV